MNYILLVCMTIMLLWIIIANRNDIISPSVLFAGSFFIGSFFLAWNTSAWDYYISTKTLFIILASVLIFHFGCCFGKIISIKRNTKTEENINYVSLANNNAFLIISLLVLLLALLIRMLDIRATGSFMGFTDGFLKGYRAYTLHTQYTTILKLLSPITNAIAYTSLYLLIFYTTSKKKIKGSLPYVRLGLIILFYLTFTALSSSRVEIVYTILAVLLLFLFLNSTFWGRRLGKKQIRIVVGSFLVLILAFYLLGFLTGKSQNQESVFDNISMYISSSIPALDYYIESFTYSIEDLGNRTLFGIRNLLFYFGIDIGTASRNMSFVVLGNMKHQTNVYTTIMPLLHDFGYLGGAIVLFIEGVVFQIVYKRMKIRFRNGNYVSLIFYIYIATLISLSCVAERIFSSLITVTSLVLGLTLIFFRRLNIKL